MTTVYPDEPTSIRSIDCAYIKNYLADNCRKGNISKAELEGWISLNQQLVESNGTRGYFAPFRSEFVKAYFPNLVKPKKVRSSESFEDFLEGLYNELA